MLYESYFNINKTTESKIMSNIYDSLDIVLDFNALYLLTDCITWSDFKNMINYFYEARNKILGCNFINPMFKIRYKYRLFSFSVYCGKNNSVSIYIWDCDGVLSIGSYHQKQLQIMKSTLENIKVDLDNFIDNKIHCSGCNMLINMKDVAGSYYAGRYCKDCWENKYKAIEAAENYD